MKLCTIRIEMNNAAFVDDPEGELKRVLSTVKPELNWGILRDVNGNTVGNWQIAGK